MNILLKTNVNLDLQDQQGKTALHCAIKYGTQRSIDLLLNKGADPYIKDNEGSTALHLAATYGHTEVLKELIKREPSRLKEKDENGRTLLHLAARKGYVKAVEFLIDQDPNSDPNIQDKYGYSVLHWAAIYPDILNILLKTNINLDLQDQQGKTALHCAIQYGTQRSIDLLLNKGADPYIKDTKGITAAMLAKQYGFKDIIDLSKESNENQKPQNQPQKYLEFSELNRGSQNSLRVISGPKHLSDPVVLDKDIIYVFAIIAARALKWVSNKLNSKPQNKITNIPSKTNETIAKLPISQEDRNTDPYTFQNILDKNPKFSASSNHSLEVTDYQDTNLPKSYQESLEQGTVGRVNKSNSRY